MEVSSTAGFLKTWGATFPARHPSKPVKDNMFLKQVGYFGYLVLGVL